MLDFFDLISNGQFDRRGRTELSFRAEGELLRVATMAALTQDVAHFETGTSHFLTLVKKNGSYTYGYNSRTDKPQVSIGSKNLIADPISYNLFNRYTDDGLRVFFNFIEHVIYTLVKQNFFEGLDYPLSGSWETTGERINKLKKNKLITN